MYGSYARGDYNKDSDIDIMILTDLTDTEILKCRREIFDFAYEIEFYNNFDITLSPLIKNINKFNCLMNENTFYKNIKKDEIVLFEQK